MQMKRLISVLVVVIFVFCSCATVVQIDSEPRGAKVTLDGRYLGETPVETQLSNAVWESYVVEIEKDGYRPVYAELRKEIKLGPGIAGFFFMWPLWLWAYGPESYQSFTLREE